MNYVVALQVLASGYTAVCTANLVKLRDIFNFFSRAVPQLAQNMSFLGAILAVSSGLACPFHVLVTEV